MSQLKIIYDGSLPSDQILISDTFKNAQFLLFDVPGQPANVGFEIGFVLVIYVTSISLLGITTLEKDVILPAQEFQGTLTSFSVIDIPREYSESGYDLKCSFNSSISLSTFKVYAVTSEVTQESLSTQITELKNKVESAQFEIAEVKTQVLNIKALVQELVLKATNETEQLENVIETVKTIVGFLGAVL